MREVRLWAIVLSVSIISATLFTCIASYCYLSGQPTFTTIFMSCSIACVILAIHSIRKVGPML